MASRQTIRVGGVRVDITGDNTEMVRAVRGASAAMRRHGRSIRELNRRYKTLSAQSSAAGRAIKSFAIATALGGGGLTQAVRSSTELGASLIETAVRANISVDALQKLARVAQGDGVEFSKLSKVLTVFNRAISQAASGVTTYEREFQRLGLSAEEFAKIPVDQAFTQLADAIAASTSQADAIQALSVILGRSGPELYNILRLGGVELQRQVDLFGELGTLTDRQAGRLKTLAQVQTDAGNRLQTTIARVVADNAEGVALIIESLTNVAVSIAQTVGPALADIAKGIRVFAALVDDLIIGYVVVKALPLLVSALVGIKVALAGASLAALTFGKVLRLVMLRILAPVIAIIGAFVALKQGIQSVVAGDSFSEYVGKLGDTIKSFINDPLDTAVDTLGLIDALSTDSPVIEPATVNVDRIGNVSETILAAQAKYRAELEATSDAERAARDALRARRAAIEENTAAMQDLIRASAREADEGEFALRIARLTGAERRRAIATRRVELALLERQRDLQQRIRTAQIDGNKIALKAAKAALADLDRIRANTAAMVQDVEDGLRRIDTAAAELAEIRRLRQTFRDISVAVGDFAERAILNFNSITDAVRDLGRAIVEAILRQVVITPLTNAISGALTNAFTGVPAPAAAPAFAPAGAAPRAASRAAAGVNSGTTVNISPTIIGSDEATVNRALTGAVPSIVDTAVGAVRRDVGRPSTLRAALAT